MTDHIDSPPDTQPTTASEAATFRAAALEALGVLGRAHGAITEQMQSLSLVLEQSETPDLLANDPDSPVNVYATLRATRAELAALREALEPFARAYSRRMDALGEVMVDVLIDPEQPAKSRRLRMNAFKRANHAFTSLSLGAETLNRIRQLEALLAEVVDPDRAPPDTILRARRLLSQPAATAR